MKLESNRKRATFSVPEQCGKFALILNWHSTCLHLPADGAGVLMTAIRFCANKVPGGNEKVALNFIFNSDYL